MVTITDKKIVFIDDNGQRDFQEGDSLGSSYYMITLSTGLVFNVKADWSEEDIRNEIQSSVDQAQDRENNAATEAQAAQNILDSL